MLKRIASIAVPVALVAICALPIVMDQPFGTQTAQSMNAAYVMRRWSPIASVLGAAALLAIGAAGWRRWRTIARVGFSIGFAVALVSIWFARQNPFEWMFNPLPRPQYVPAARAAFVAPADLVLAVRVGDDAAAYPIRQLAYHHLVNDRIGRTPAVVTY
jgi:hypothetical protein